MKIASCDATTSFIQPLVSPFLVTWCDGTAIRDCWITTLQEMRNMAVIENRSGSLTCEKILGVPAVNGHDQRLDR